MSCHRSTSLLLLHFSLFHLCFSHVSSSSLLPDRYFKSIPTSLRQNISDEYFELSNPLPSDSLKPFCTLELLQEDFGNTIGSPPVSVTYSPPEDCPGPWTHVVLEFRASCQGEQYDRIAGIWLEGVEILRTSTAEPTESGIFWKVRKDVTRYSSLLVRSDLTLTVMLENVVNDVFTGVYHVNVSLLYYGVKETRVLHGVADQTLNRKFSFLSGEGGKLGITDGKLGLSSEEPRGRSKTGQIAGPLTEKPADLIIPLSDDGNGGFWFRIQNEMDVHSKEIRIPLNTYRAVLEIYVSFHGDDEFWYSNPPNSYITMNNLTTGRGNGAFRQVIVTIDGGFAGSVLPFPVIFTGGINPLFWEPIVAIGAFNLPSYDLDFTPFIGFLLDGKSHSFGLRVTDGIPFWLVDANLHLWLDPCSCLVMAKSILDQAPTFSVERKSKFEKLDGSFKIEAERKIEFSGWVSSLAGNFTTRVSQEFKFKNKIKFKSDGQLQDVKQKIKAKTKVTVESDAGGLLSESILNSKYPLNIETSTLPGSDSNTYLSITSVSHALYEKSSHALPSGDYSSSISNSQASEGWMVVQDHSVLAGGASTQQTLTYKDETGSYSQTVTASNGKLLEAGN